MPPASKKNMAAFRHGVLYVFLNFFYGCLIDQGTLLNIGLKAITDFEFSDCGDQFPGKGVIDAGLDVEPVRTYAGLPGVAIFGNDRPFNGRIEVGIVEYDKGRIPAKLQGKLLYRGGALFHEQTADFR